MIKRVSAVILCGIILLSICGCSKAQKAQKNVNEKIENRQSAISVAINPVISFRNGKKDTAFDSIYKCMEQDYSSNKYSLSADTNWHWMYYDEKESVWIEKQANAVTSWQNCKYENKKEQPYVYSFSDDGITSLLPYTSKNVRVLPYVLDTAPDSGLILSVSGASEEGLCYTVPEDGIISISDPTKSQISIVRRIGETQTYSLDNDKISRSARVIIYQNGKPLWATEFANPKYYSSTKEKDGVYAIPFPKLDNIKVKAGDLLSIVVENGTDFRTPESFIPKKTDKFVEASKVEKDEIKNYISVGGKPYLLNGIQIRLDRATDKFKCFTREEKDEFIEPYFKQAVDLGYQTVIVPVRWRDIELKENSFSFETLEIYYEYLKKYDLKIQLLWFGSDVCGFNTSCPSYVLTNKQKYSRLKDYPDILNYGDMDLVERELNAFNKLLDFLAKCDKECRTVSIQITNEPNACAYGGPTVKDFTDAAMVDAGIWCAGQYEAIKAIINALGMCVKNGPYRCVTRLNFITFQCMYNGLRDWQVEEICNLEGLDIAGFDSYDSNVSTYLMAKLNYGNNISHYPEFGVNHSNAIPQILQTFSERSGILVYQMKVVDEDNAGVIFADTENVWNMPHGEPVEKDGKVVSYRIDGTELRALNLALGKAGEKITLNDPEKTAVFNTGRSTTCNENVKIGNIGVRFANSGAKNFGGCGYITAVSDKEFILFATRGNSTFVFENCSVASVSAGSYDSDGKWKSDGEIGASNTITIPSKEADNGTLYKVSLR